MDPSILSQRNVLESDALDDAVVWTPAIERLAQDVVRWIRLDTPGGAVFGKQRNGKSCACTYLSVVLSSIIGYPIASVVWSIPSNVSVKERDFTQERLRQSGSTAILHRDVAVLRGRLYEHIAQLAASICARRVVVMIDEAQNLDHLHYGYIIHCYNELVNLQVRPFFLLIGQPDLRGATSAWEHSRAHQVVGRFHVNKHVFLGIHQTEFEVVLAEFDKPVAPESPSAAQRLFPVSYAAGWRIADLAPALREAIMLAMKQHNLGEDVRIPMQYLRSTVLAYLYRTVEGRREPADASGAVLLKCLRDSGFLAVIGYYAESEKSEHRLDDE